MTPEGMALAHQQSRLEQSCPACGRWEAAGRYCSGCGRPMTVADWYANGDQTRRSVARQIAPRGVQTPLKGAPEAAAGSVDPETAQNGSRTAAA